MSKQTYNLVNMMKIIASFFVVAIHIHFPGVFGQCVIDVARFAVPFFFAVSGFFSYYEDDKVFPDKMKHKLQHILRLIIGSFLLYFVFYGTSALVKGSFRSYAAKFFSVKSIAILLLFNQPHVSELLWFLPALLYVYLIFYGLKKTGFIKRSAFLIPLLSVGGILFREVKEFLPNAPSVLDNAFLYRNFLFVGLPFFLMGYFVRLHKDRLTEKLSSPVLILLMLAGFCESILVEHFHTQKSVYIGTIFAVFALFVLLIKHENNIHAPVLSSFGAKYSLYIYILHYLVYDSMNKIGAILPPIQTAMDFITPIKPVVIFLITLAVSAIYVALKNAVIKLLRKQKT